MPTVRILKNWRGLPAGIFADVRGQHLADGLAEGAVDPNAKIENHADAKLHPEPVGEDEPKAKAKAKP